MGLYLWILLHLIFDSEYFFPSRSILKFLTPKEDNDKAPKRRQISLILHECFHIHSVIFMEIVGLILLSSITHSWILWWLDYMLHNK